MGSLVTTVLLCVVDGRENPADVLAWFVDIGSGLVWIGEGVCEVTEQPEYGYACAAFGLVAAGLNFAHCFTADDDGIIRASNVA